MTMAFAVVTCLIVSRSRDAGVHDHLQIGHAGTVVEFEEREGLEVAAGTTSRKTRTQVPGWVVFNAQRYVAWRTWRLLILT
ncbi:MAG: hypothetical protein R3B90_04755 [Planctomycetaceae bacterium]